MSVAQQVLNDLSQALEVDRVKSFEQGRLAERSAQFEALKEAYERGLADAVPTFIGLLDNESVMCTCETPLDHLRERIQRLARVTLIKGEQK